MWMLLAAACGEPDAGPSATVPPPSDADPTATVADDTDDPAVPDTGPEDPCEVDAVDPGHPPFPATIGTVTVTVATGTGTYNGTTDTTLELCLTDTRCLPLALGKGNQLLA